MVPESVVTGPGWTDGGLDGQILGTVTVVGEGSAISTADAAALW